jgi:hypothetical protein
MKQWSLIATGVSFTRLKGVLNIHIKRVSFTRRHFNTMFGLDVSRGS